MSSPSASEDIARLYAQAKAYYRAELQGTVMHRAGVGDIRFSSAGWKKFRGGSKSDVLKLKLLIYVRAIIATGQYSGRQALAKDRTDGYVAFHFFQRDIEVDGLVVRAGVTIAEVADGKLFYNASHDASRSWAKKKGLSPQGSEAPDSQPHLSGSDEPTLDGILLPDEHSVNIAILAIRPVASLDSVDEWMAIETAAQESAFGRNSRPEATPAQCEAGNYKLGACSLKGLPIRIENPRGSYRAGTGPDGRSWRSRMAAHYGYIAGTVGADGEAIDCFIGPWPESDTVYVVHQQRRDGQLDEHKVIFGAIDADHARRIYLDCYARNWPGLRDMAAVTIDQFRWWLKNGNTRLVLDPSSLPRTGAGQMNRVIWDDVTPRFEKRGIAGVLYSLRLDDADTGALFETPTADDLAGMFDPDLALDSLTLDALVVESRRLERVCAVVQRVLTRFAGDSVKPAGFDIGAPRTLRGVVNVAVTFNLSDGQKIVIFFHNPDTTPRKLKPDDELISWKWLLNKKDVTIAVAPEYGRDLDVGTVARRVMALAEKNSAAFVKAQARAAADADRLVQLRGDIESKQATLKDLEQQIEAARNSPAETVDRRNEREAANLIKALAEMAKDGAPFAEAERKARAMAAPDVIRLAVGSFAGFSELYASLLPAAMTIGEVAHKVASILAETGWKADNGTAIASKIFETAVGPKQAHAYLADFGGDSVSYMLTGDYQSEGRNILAGSPALIRKDFGPGSEEAVMAFSAEVDKLVSQSYAAKLLEVSPVDDSPQVSPADSAGDDGYLPAGWTEAAPGQIATNPDPLFGGIVDKEIASGKWFVIFNDDAIPGMDGFATRKEAFDAFAAALESARLAREAAAPPPAEVVTEPNADVAAAQMNPPQDPEPLPEAMPSQDPPNTDAQVPGMEPEPGDSDVAAAVEAMPGGSTEEPAPIIDAQREADVALLRNVASGESDFQSPDLAAQLQAIFDRHPNDEEIARLLEAAAKTYQARMISAAQQALSLSVAA